MSEVYKAKWILPANEEVFENKALIVKEGKILDIIDDNKIQEYFGEEEHEFYDYGNAILTPGFINLHTHLQYTEIGTYKPKNKNALLKRFLLMLKKFFMVGYIPSDRFMNWMINVFTCSFRTPAKEGNSMESDSMFFRFRSQAFVSDSTVFLHPASSTSIDSSITIPFLMASLLAF